MTPMKNTAAMCLTVLVLVVIRAPRVAAAGRPAPPVISRLEDGRVEAAGQGYTAVIDRRGYLSSYRVDGVETVGSPFSYQPGAHLVEDAVTTSDGRVTVHLKGAGEATITYDFRPDGFTITPTWKGNGYAEFQFSASPSLTGIELLNYKGNTAGGVATRFVSHGEIRGVPAVVSASNQMVRFHYPGLCLRAYVQTWGAPFNYESAGIVRDYTWGRPLLDANRAFPIVFRLEHTPPGPRLHALPFVPRSEKVASLYYTGEPCVWNLDLGGRTATQYLLDAGVHSLRVDWTLLDFHDAPVSAGHSQFSLPGDSGPPVEPVIVRPPGSGYYSAIFRLSDGSGRMLESSFRTRFTVIHRIEGMVNRDDSLLHTSRSDYATMGMIGAGALRESHPASEFFTQSTPSGQGWEKVEGAVPTVWMNGAELDRVFGDAARESARFHETWFYQANSRPSYATPAVYQAMAQALVAREHKLCHVWEVENEPNFSYTPENYVNECLIPFAKGAKAADPGCVIMGPGCVSLKQTLEFMDVIYRLGANRWLDNVSTHTYPGPGESWEQFGNTATIPELRRWMAAHGDGSKALWQTEQGYAWDNSGKAQSARYTVRQFLEGARMGIAPDHQYYFYPQAHGFEDWYLSGNGEAGSEQSWLPSGAALRFFAENLNEFHYAGDIPSPYKGIFLARFTREGQNVVAAWTFDFSERLPVRISGTFSAVGFMGNRLKLPRSRAGVVVLPLSGEPIYIHLAKGVTLEAPGRYGPDLALTASGAGAAASSSAASHPANYANDGNWQLWENVIGLPGRTAWQSGVMNPTPDRPDWVQLTFPEPRSINRIVALCYLPAVSASPRDFQFQVRRDGRWQTVAVGKNEAAWVFNRTFPAVQASAVRMEITAINDGWQGGRRWMSVLMGDASHYTDSKVLISELEVYGPALGEKASPSIRSGGAAAGRTRRRARL